MTTSIPDVSWLSARLEQLQTLSADLAVAVDQRQVASAVIHRLSEPVFASTIGIWLERADHDRLELVAQRGMPADAAAQFAIIDVGADVPVAIAHREQRTVQTTDRPETEPEFAGLRGAVRITSGFVAVPLSIGGRSLGAVSVGYNDRPFREDVLFVEAIASQAAQALVRVGLAQGERRRRAELEFMGTLTEAALNAGSHRELMRNVTQAAVPTLGDWCAVHYLPIDSTSMEVAVAHADPARKAWAEELQARFPANPDADTGPPAVIRSGVTELLDFTAAEVVERALATSPIEPDEARTILAELKLTSVITVPLRTKRRIVGAIQFVSAESGRRYGPDDVALAEVVAGRLAEPLDGAWVTDQHVHIAETLQRTLLPPRLPTVPGVQVAARYLPAGPGAVGGDFYDVFALGDDSWAILIGDACGKGPDAAALSSIARHTVRAAARHGTEPAEVMQWLNQAIGLSDRNLSCTACYATLTRRGGGRWSLRSVVGGHPLPVLVHGESTATLGRHGTLLGMFPTVDVQVEEVELTEGDVVIFYTDGATDLPPPSGMTEAEFLDLVRGPAGETADQLADRIDEVTKRRVTQGQRGDDLALVILRFMGNDD